MNAELGPNAGLDQLRFNPNGALSKVGREALPILGGQTALLEQAAYPPVAELLVFTCKTQAGTIRKLRGDARAGFDIIFGTNNEVMQVTTHINSVHANPDFRRTITSTTGAITRGTPYSPRTQEGLGIVGATLIEGSIEGYKRFVGELTPDEEDSYVREAKELYGYLGLKPESLPDTYAGIRTHIETMIKDRRLAVGDAALSLAPYILLEHASVPNALRRFMRLFALDALPEELMRQYGLKVTPGERKTARRRAEDIRKAVPYLPPPIRYNPQFLVAQRRQNGETIAPWQKQRPRFYWLLRASKDLLPQRA